ncbi:hypothetical protein LXL04_008799 [Taraxacum kok-saghyz]
MRGSQLYNALFFPSLEFFPTGFSLARRSLTRSGRDKQKKSNQMGFDLACLLGERKRDKQKFCFLDWWRRFLGTRWIRKGWILSKGDGEYRLRLRGWPVTKKKDGPFVTTSLIGMFVIRGDRRKCVKTGHKESVKADGFGFSSFGRNLKV